MSNNNSRKTPQQMYEEQRAIEGDIVKFPGRIAKGLLIINVVVIFQQFCQHTSLWGWLAGDNSPIADAIFSTIAFILPAISIWMINSHSEK